MEQPHASTTHPGSPEHDHMQGSQWVLQAEAVPKYCGCHGAPTQPTSLTHCPTSAVCPQPALIPVLCWHHSGGRRALWMTSCSISRSCAQPGHTVCGLLLPWGSCGKISSFGNQEVAQTTQSLAACGLSALVPVQRSCRLRTDTGVHMAELSQSISSAHASRAFCCGAQPQRQPPPLC